MKNKNIDMTKGKILPQLLAFTLPLIMGNVFQLMYNMVDTIVIGRFAGSVSLAAVGTCDPVMTLLIHAVSGVCVGSSVMMSRFFGAGKMEELKKEMCTTVSIGLLAAAIILAGGVFLCRPILLLLQVPGDIMGEAMIYLRIIFLGMPFTCLYNIYAAGLRSIGDSKTPLRYLMISSVLNMLMDLVLVACFHMGVAGAGLATLVAEGVSAVLCMIYVEREIPLLQFSPRDLLNPDKELANQTIRYGGVTALQQCAQPMGNLLIQGSINTLGSASIAAFHAVRKIEDIGLVPGRTIGSSIMTFTAQNVGANNPKRREEGYYTGMSLEAATSVLLCLIIFVLKRPLLLLFTSDESIIAEGLTYYAVMAVAYWMPCFTNGIQGYFRGIGAMKTTLLATITQISVRVLFTFLLVSGLGMGIQAVGMACMAGWMAMLLWEVPYRRYRRKLL